VISFEKGDVSMLRDESGFSMLEVLIAGAITVIVAFGIATLVNSTNKQETNIRVKQEAFSYQQQMRYERKVAEPVQPD
jgi:Tfp pilus assembly protein PilV